MQFVKTVKWLIKERNALVNKETTYSEARREDRKHEENGKRSERCVRGERIKKKRLRGRQGEVNRRRGRCSCLGCLCANNYPDEIH